ncbi:glycosyltransferase 87 family protein [Pseudoalteromonas sp. SCSIO 43210]
MNLQLFKPSFTTKSKSWLYFISLASLIALSFSSYFLANTSQSNTEFPVGSIGVYTIIQYCLMAFFMLVAWSLSPKSRYLKNYKLLLITAFLMRIVLIDVEPYTSNDTSRYLFDGRIAYEGYDPYSISHDAIELTQLREQWQPPKEHAAYVTIYPPLALALFTFSSSFGVEKAQLVWRFLLLLAGLLTVYVSALVLKKANKLNNLALVALSPLLILETGVGLHIDAFSALAVVVAIYFWQRQLLLYCGIAIGIGMSLKILPVMLLLPLFFLQKSLKPALMLVLSWVTTVALIYGTTIALGYVPVGSISVFFEKWRNASPIFTALDSLLTNSQVVLALFVMGVIAVLFIAYTSFRYSKARYMSTSVIYFCMQAALALPLMLSPVLFPWYLLPLVPLLALRPNIYLLTWLLLMPMTYEVLGNFLCCQQWQPALWPVVLLGVLYALTLLRLIYHGIKKTSKLNHIDNS